MGNPSTASNDPIYWSFHAYVDLVWARWQRLHQQTFGCGDCTVWLEPNSYKVNEKVTTNDWGYEYDYNFSPDGAPIAVAAKTGGTTPLSVTEMSDRSATAGITIPQGDTRKILIIEYVRPLSDASYRIHVYLHPADVRLADLTEEQRRQYLIRTVTIWQSVGHHPDAFDVPVDLTNAVKENATTILERLRSTMPPSSAGGPWPSELVTMFERWVSAGCPRLLLGEGSNFQLTKSEMKFYHLECVVSLSPVKIKI
jgi:Common central domain of tyrosinase